MRNLIFVLALAATPALAGSYSASDAAHVTDSKDPDVLNYVVCLANNSDNPGRPSFNALQIAKVSCRGFAAKIKAGGWDAQDIEDSIAECGLLPDGDPNDDMGCE